MNAPDRELWKHREGTKNTKTIIFLCALCAFVVEFVPRS
jgi:hypothetical protein